MGCYSRLKNVLGGMAICVACVFQAQQVEAADTKMVTGVCEYDVAYEVLEIVNEERSAAGAEKLEMDQDLLTAAMLRAAECTVAVSHERPNGTDCFAACEKIYGENIAYGYRSAEAVMEAWMESEGHKRNILNSGYKSIGIGCYYANGGWYWTQCFGYAEAEDVSQPSDCSATYEVSMTSGTETKLVNNGASNRSADTDTSSVSKVSKFKATAGKRKLSLTWKKQSGISGYELQISKSSNFKSKQTSTINKNTTKKVIQKYKGEKLKAGKKYYVRIRAYKKGEDSSGNIIKQYGKWNTLTKKTKQ